MTRQASGGFAPPPYPYDRLDPARRVADGHEGGLVDLSVGTPLDPPATSVVAALADADRARTYPASIGIPELREAAARWIMRLFGTEVPTSQIAACVGSKEFVTGLPHLLKLRDPSRDTVLFPAVSYPSYEMGARLAGLRPVPVALGTDHAVDLASVDPEDAERALLLWVNTPGNPTGGLDDLGAVAAWGRARGVIVASDECYAEFTWRGPPRTILQHGTDGVLAVHSLSKRSNLAGARVGFYAGDGDLVEFVSEVRKHQGLMVPGPCQVAAVAALDDVEHAASQVSAYRSRLDVMAEVLSEAGFDAPIPRGAFYLWVPTPEGEWPAVDRLARDGGAIVAPGEFYGSAGRGFVRVAVVQSEDRLRLVGERLVGAR